MAHENRLIDANKISNAIALYLAENAYLNDTAQDALEMVAKWIEDAVEATHCKDCEHWQDHEGLHICEHFSSMGLPGLGKNIIFCTRPTDYCSFARWVKRDEAETEDNQ